MVVKWVGGNVGDRSGALKSSYEKSRICSESEAQGTQQLAVLDLQITKTEET